MDRRQLLSFIAMAVSAPLFSQCMRREKMVHRVVSQNGLLELSLTAQAHTRQLAGQRTRLLAYNGQMPGPRLEARAGDRDGKIRSVLKAMRLLPSECASKILLAAQHSFRPIIYTIDNQQKR